MERGEDDDYDGGEDNVRVDDEEKKLDETNHLLDTENGIFHQRMWASFQNCARAIAQVYVSNKQVKESTPKHVEESFKSAAQHATNLYKDSLDTSRRLIDVSLKTGANRKTSQILAFVKSRKKRFIRKDELINFIIGANLPPKNNHNIRKIPINLEQSNNFSALHYFTGVVPSSSTCCSSSVTGSSDPSMVLAVEQLFVGQNQQGVKRPAADEKEDDEDMEDADNNISHFKRMRF